MLLPLLLIAGILSAGADNHFGSLGSFGSSGFGLSSSSHFGSSSSSHFDSPFGSSHSSIFGDDPFFGPRKKPEEEKGIGVCFIDIPTESVAGNKNVILIGEGTRPGMSRVRSCCKDYTMNPRNNLFCEPHCTRCRENSYCVGVELCGCVPDLAKNLDGWCVPTCPKSCQNGHCEGETCRCNPGYQLHVFNKFCVPTCSQGCGAGNCTAPNTCS